MATEPPAIHSNVAKVMVKLALLPKIIEAANLLHSLNLIDEEPHVYVKRYVLANPDINQHLNK